MSNLILAINPGSTSTKVAVYEDENRLFIKNIKHTVEELAPFTDIASQFPFRKAVILQLLKENQINLSEIKAVIGRGGLIRFIESGIYEVNEEMIKDLKTPPNGQHASNLGGLIASDIARELGVKAYIADPVVVDELQDVARISGHPLFTRKSIFHALNHKAIARTYAKSIGRRYEELNLIVAHLGGGVSVAAHCSGRVIDVNNALDGEGPMSPERAGTLPTGELVDLCFSGKYTREEVRKMLVGRGGLVAFLGTSDALEVENRSKEDPSWNRIQEALFYQVGKSIGEMAAVLKGKVDAILLTGGIAYNPLLKSYLEEMVGFIAPIKAYGGEDEMGALAGNALMVLRGEIAPKQY